MNDPNEKVYYPGLDGLRGIAILLVVLYHYFPFFRIGWIGVDLFFVLSGFLITSILLRTRNKRDYFKNFYIRRSLRIFPLYFLFLLLFYIGLQLFFHDRSATSAYTYYTKHQLWFVGFLQNWLIIKEGPPPEPYLIHFWSLAVEEQFYLAWPFMIFFIKEMQKVKIFLMIIILAALVIRCSLWLYQLPNQPYYYNSFARFDSLAAGSFLAINFFEKRTLSTWTKRLAYLAFSILLCTAWLGFHNFEHNSLLFATFGYSASAFFFAVICEECLHRKSFLHLSFLQYLGRISYGIYVYHLPVFLAGTSVLKQLTFFRNDNQTITTFVCLLATLVISTISYYILEVPFLKLKHKFV